jgi:hypothetical protein
MADMMPTRRTFTWAPKTLVVISCALALLAMQPAMGTGTSAQELRRGVVLEGVMPSADSNLHETSARPARGIRTPGTARSITHADAWLGSARKLHILATMEILHRLLIGELHNTQVQAVAGLWVDDICIGVAIVPLVTKGGEAWAADDLPMREREFAIGHCLLAPPLC